MFVFNKESKTLFKNKIESIEKSPYAFYEKKKNLKPHNILIIESELDALSWEKILNQVSKGSDAMILAEEFPQELQDTLEIEHRDFNYGEESNIYLTDEKVPYDSLVIDKDQAHGSFSKINLDKTEILGEEYYETSEAVSYTHLDVYKRQHYDKDFVTMILGEDYVNTVSYTHLDVYKRQI